jgi:hypothetical protein
MPLILSGNVASATAGAYDVANSCRFNDGDSPHMEKTHGTSTDVDKCTISVWVKRSALGGTKSIFGYHTDDNNRGSLVFEADQLDLYINDSGSVTTRLVTTQVFRDVSAWYHIVLSVDTGQGTAASRVRLYVNGSEITDFGTETNPDQNLNFGLNNSSIDGKVGQKGENNDYFDGYMAEFVFIDGLQLTPSSFGEFDSDSPTIWKPKDVSGLTFGTNGFYLDFEDSANLGNDANGGTDLTEVNLAATDQATDTPTNNFATFNSIAQWDTGGSHVFSEGNLKAVLSSDLGKASSTIGVTAGKWYMEIKQTAENVPLGNSEGIIGVIGDPIYTTSNWSGWTNGFVMVNQSGYAYTGASSALSWHGNWSVGDIIGVALDMDNMKVYFSKGGQWNDGSGNWDESSPNAYLTLSSSYSTYFLALSHSHNTATETFEANFGSPSFAISSGNADADGYGNFEYAVPSGYYALCTKNLAEYG